MAVAYEVRLEQVRPRILAAVREIMAPGQVGARVIGLLDQVWPVLREQGARAGHNVFVYHAGEDGMLTVDAGVEVFAGFTERGAVRRMATPAGQAATTAHYGDYSGLGAAYTALEEWCARTGRNPVGVNWEVYGDWTEDPARLRTDVYFLLTQRAAGGTRASGG